MNINPTPNFEDFESSSTASRKVTNQAFYLLCILVATLSVVILGILLTTIVIAALPTFGPHSDHINGTNRFAIIQSPNSDESMVDKGDIIQGVLAFDSIERGGLDRQNDESFVSQESTRVTRLGLYSFEIVKKIRKTDLDVLFRVKPANGKNSISSLLATVNVSADLPDSSGLVVLDCQSSPFDLQKVKFDSISEHLDQNSSIAMVCGTESADDFIELKLKSDSLEVLRDVDEKKKAGQLNGCLSIFEFIETDTFKPIRVRSFETSELVSGHLKIEEEYLRGLPEDESDSGFLFGGQLDLVYCPLSEKTVSTWGHIAHFLTQPPKSEAPGAAVSPAIMGSVWIIACCAIFALPIGVGTAIFLEEFKPTNKILLFFHSLIQLNISNLAGVPSIVYGILGLTAFAFMFEWFGKANEPDFQFGADHFYQYVTEGDDVVMIPVDNPRQPPELVDGIKARNSLGETVELNIIGEDDDFPEDDELLARSLYFDSDGGLFSNKYWYYFQLPFGRGVLAASLTLMLVILPVIIIATQEALRAVPSSLREGALGLGSTPWQVVKKVTLPAAIPSIMTGAILSMSRAIGEAAPILILCGIVYVTVGPQHLMDTFSVLPIQIYFWTGEPVDRSLLINFQNVAAAGIVVLLVILLTFNAIAILIRQFTQKPMS